MSAPEKQYWVRNEQGRVWGPYTALALERLRGQISEKWNVSLDGKEFHPSADFPELRALLSAPRVVAKPLSQEPPEEATDEESGREALRAAARAAVEAERARRGSSPGTRPAAAAHDSQPGVAPAPGAGRDSQPGISRPPPAPAPPPVEEKLEVPDEGELERHSPVRLYALAALTSASGWMQLVNEAGRMLQISFRRGTPEHLESDDPELSLLRFLIKRGTVSAAQGLQAEEHVRRTGADVVTALFQLQLIPPAEAHKLLGEHMFSLLDRALITWRGRFAFERDAPPPPGSFPLGQRWTLLAEAIRRLDTAPLRARLGKRLHRPVLRSGGLGIGKVEELALSAQESRLYAAIDGVRTGDELLKSQDANVTLRLLYLLIELGHLAFGEEQQPAAAAAAQPGPTAPRPAPAPENKLPPRVAPPRPSDQPRVPPPMVTPVGTPAVSAPPPAASPPGATPPHGTAPPPATAKPVSTPPRPAGIAPPAGPPPGASRPPPPRQPPPAPPARPPPPPAPVRPSAPPAPGSIAAMLSGPPGETPVQQLARLTGLWQRMDKATHFEAMGLDRKVTAAEAKKAFFVLARELHPDTVSDGNLELRAIKERLFSRVNEASQVLGDEKRRKEYEEELDGKAGAVDVARIFAAEESFQRGEIMIKARKYADGLKLIEEAIALNDQEAEFYAWRGWARFLIAKDRKAQYPESVADCKKAVQLIPVCLPGWLFLANMAKAMNELKEAERHYKKVLDLDPKHVDAQRELRLMGKK